ncbi:MAG: preprotein translocase subunit SecE [Bacilli bacterium]|nr:preprotein translocase subunit SecE [Bacilli bacterium]
MKKGSEKKESLEKVVTEKKNNKKVTLEKETAKKNKHYIAEKKVVKTKKEKKENIFKRIGKYFKGVSKELKRIRWTDKKDLLKYSICTLAFVLFFGVYFYAIDWIALLVRSLAK